MCYVFLFHLDTLVPVTRVQLGEPATFTCDLTDELNRKICWYRQSAGGNLKLIVSLSKDTNPVYGPDFSDSKLEAKFNKKMSILTILKTQQEDEGMYHCAAVDWNEITWSATYLSLRGNTQRTLTYTVQWSTVSDPVRPGNSVTLQCSVLSDSENKTCSEDHSVFWFRAGSDKSHPDIIYADGNRHNQCDKSQKRCVYRFSKNVSSSDDGTYYCAVATCGEILFGNGTKLNIQESKTSYELIALVVAVVCLIISVTGNIVFICYRTPRTGCEQNKGIES
ncbi:immunoglobulin superfamily member 2-like, partial [Larimichthys crocea]|uniref:immunoglobulin superfamily member 2-like n=1 Tax=Larimichthys crocea TaxID=215358 RepID=UPI000F5DCCC7